MQWSDVTRTPPSKMLRQFAGLFLVFFLAFAGLRWYRGQHDQWTVGLAIVAVVVGVAGMLIPAVVRPIYSGWMIVAFPIGWTITRLTLGVLFFLVITPIAWIFRQSGRDALHLRRTSSTTYWREKRQPGSLRDYFRQA